MLINNWRHPFCQSVLYKKHTACITTKTGVRLVWIKMKNNTNTRNNIKETTAHIITNTAARVFSYKIYCQSSAYISFKDFAVHILIQNLCNQHDTIKIKPSQSKVQMHWSKTSELISIEMFLKIHNLCILYIFIIRASTNPNYSLVLKYTVLMKTQLYCILPFNII